MRLPIALRAAMPPPVPQPIDPPPAQPSISTAGRMLRALGAVAIAASGLALAWPFRLNPDSPIIPAAPLATAPAQADAAQVAFQSSNSGAAPTVDVPASLPPKRLARQVTASQEPIRPSPTKAFPQDVAPPELSPQFARSNAYPSRQVLDSPGDSPRDRESREHRLVDGDTLYRLAQRYLGDANRWPEIQAANLETLSNPAVIPLGKTIRIPPRSTASVESSPLETSFRPLTPLPIGEPAATLP